MDNSGNRYSVLLVDDEEDVIRIIMKKLDWESMGLVIIGHAANGVEALEMAEELSPDIVMTDIKMPYMDGLTLCKKLKELSRTIRVIIFSGFDEFEYAKEAIKMEAAEYLLKPVNAVELKEVFERVKNDLDRELDEKRNTDKLRAYYMESLPVLQESFYMALLEGRIAPEQIGRYMDSYQVQLQGPYYVVAVLHISQQSLEEESRMDPFLQAVSVRKFAEEQVEDRWRSRVVIYLGDIIMISQMHSREEMLEYTNEMDRLCRMAKKVCNARITAGIGYLCDNLEQLPLSYQGAKQAVSYRAALWKYQSYQYFRSGACRTCGIKLGGCIQHLYTADHEESAGRRAGRTGKSDFSVHRMAFRGTDFDAEIPDCDDGASSGAVSFYCLP